MTSTSIRKGKQIRIMLAALCTVAMLSGCTQPTRTTTITGHPSSGAGLPAAVCKDSLILGWADNGSTHCVRRYAIISIDLRPAGPEYPVVEWTDSLLGMDITPGNPSATELVALVRGTSVVTWPGKPCKPATATGSCQPWAVTVIVK